MTKKIEDEFSHLPTPQARWKARHPEARKAGNRRRYERSYEKDPEIWKLRAKTNSVARRYGLTVEEYDTLIQQPCEICGQVRPKMCIDHSESGSYHGVLCNRCNMSIGGLLHDPEIMQRAVEYVVRTRTKS